MDFNGHRVIYVGFKLEPTSKYKLREMSHLDIPHGDHVTLAYGNAVTPAHMAVLGRHLELRAQEWWSDGKAVALTVAWPGWVCPCCNARAHVTLSTKEGVCPVHSNELFRDTRNRGRRVDMPIYGHVEAFLDNGTWTCHGRIPGLLD